MKRIGDCEGQEGYSIWENTDKELVAKIKAFKLVEDENVVHDMFQGECEVIERISDTEVLAKNKNGKHVMLNPPPTKERLLQAINEEFNVEDYFTQNFGIIASRGNIIMGIHNVMPPNTHRKEAYDEVSVAALHEFRMDTSFYDCFDFEGIDCHGSVNCFFDENGNYVNRDYNFDIANFEVVDPKEYKQKQVDEFINKVSKKVSEELYHIEDTNTWFSKRFAYTLNMEYEEFDIYKSFKLHVNAQPKQGKANAYYHNGCSSNSSKLSKKCEKEIVTKESFLNTLRGELEVALELK